jgi:hypothetical protein
VDQAHLGRADFQPVNSKRVAAAGAEEENKGDPIAKEEIEIEGGEPGQPLPNRTLLIFRVIAVGS